MTVTVVICTRNRPALLEKCLKGVQNLSPPPDQVLVVDNTKGDPETERVSRSFGARYVIEPTAGLLAAKRRAQSELKTDMLVFLNDEIVPEEGWLALLLPHITGTKAADNGDPELPPTLM